MRDSVTREADLRTLAGRLGLTLGSFHLFDRALTHSSAGGDSSDALRNNESLEFLGDAVLGLAVAEWLYAHVPNLPPGQYTQMRARVVNKRSLAAVAETMNLGQYVRMGRGEETAGGRHRAGLLADCFEAMVGAVFLDAGWIAARDLVVRSLRYELEAAPHSANAWDYRSQLQNFCQAHQWPLPEFVVVSESGPDHRKVFEVAVSVRGSTVGTGRGATKKEAEQHAAQAALEHDSFKNEG